MEREIKFRAWDGKMMYHCLTIYNGVVWNTVEDKPIDWPIMQYIGRADLNGIPMYEGDIIESINYPKNKRGKIIYNSETSGFSIEWLTKTDWNNLIHVRTNTIKVIGNVYQNPELI